MRSRTAVQCGVGERPGDTIDSLRPPTQQSAREAGSSLWSLARIPRLGFLLAREAGTYGPLLNLEKGDTRLDSRRVQHLPGKGGSDQNSANLVHGHAARRQVAHVGGKLRIVPAPCLDDLQFDRDMLA